MNEQHSKKESTSFKNAGGYALSILFWLVVWFAIAKALGNDLLLAGPIETLESFGRSLTMPSFWSAVGYTSLRVVVTGFISSVLAVIISLLSSYSSVVKMICAPVLQVMKSAPVACLVVIVLVAWGSDGAFIAIVAFVAFPPVYAAMQQAVQERKIQTEEALRLFGLGKWKIFFVCTWQTAIPFFVAASKTAVALSWRAGITAELLALPLGSMGAGVYVSKLTLDSAGILVWTIMVMLLSWLNETIVIWLLRLSRNIWKPIFKNGRGTNLANPVEPKLEPETGSGSLAKPSMNSNSRDLSGVTSEDISHEPDVLELSEVKKGFGETRVIENLSLKVSLDERICLMAPTGAGKTTALRLLLKIYDPESGTVHAPAEVGVVMQESTLLNDLTAFENVALTTPAHINDSDIKEALESLLPEDALDKKASELSGGMKRLVEIVRAMLSDGKAIVLDEPFAGLDTESHKKACAFILENLRDRPLIAATHDAEDARYLDADILYI